MRTKANDDELAALLRSAAEVLDSSIRSVEWDDNCPLQRMWRQKYEDIGRYMSARGYGELRSWPEEIRRKMARAADPMSHAELNKAVREMAVDG